MQLLINAFKSQEVVMYDHNSHSLLLMVGNYGMLHTRVSKLLLALTSVANVSNFNFDAIFRRRMRGVDEMQWLRYS